MKFREISQEELDDILEKHKKWLTFQGNGECADLAKANLTYANLRHANLTNANLRHANLTYANLTNADLTNANLTYADLTNADLTNADLTYADLTNADLTNANLTDADLTNANLTYADLTNANLRYAKIWDTNFSNVIGKTIISIQLNTSVENRVINYIPEIDWVSAGCFHGTLEDLENKVKIKHEDNEKIRKRYEKAIEFIRFLEKDYKND